MTLEALRKDMVAAMKAKDKNNEGCSVFTGISSKKSCH